MFTLHVEKDENTKRIIGHTDKTSFLFTAKVDIVNGPFLASYSLFRLFNSKQQTRGQYKSLPITGFKPRTSGVGSDRSANWASTTVQVDTFWSFVRSYLLQNVNNFCFAKNMAERCFDHKTTGKLWRYFVEFIKWFFGSVTRLGKMLPLWQNLKSIWQFLRVYLVFHKNWPCVANFECHWANFHSYKWPNIKKYLAIWSHCFSVT